MIAVDTNILVYSVREDSPWRKAALACVRRLAEGTVPWTIAWPSIHEFLAIVTHPHIYKPATTLADAIRQVDYWLESPSLLVAPEESGYWEHFKPLAIAAKVAGPLVHDARVAAICLACGAREIWTAGRDFSRFPGLLARNPLLTSR